MRSRSRVRWRQSRRVSVAPIRIEPYREYRHAPLLGRWRPFASAKRAALFCVWMAYAFRIRGSLLRAASVLAFACVVAAATPQASAQEGRAYTIGPLDVLQIHVFNEPSLNGRFTVGVDGAISFPLVGRVMAGNRTMQALEEELRERLLEGYFQDPRVTVNIAAYRSRRVFILGEVRRPGAYPVTGAMTLVELLARAGATTELASVEAVVARAGGLAPEPPTAQEGDGGKTLRVNLEALSRGDISQNVTLRHGDTVFVPRAGMAYVFGAVRNPGRYAIRHDATVLQVLSLAGGGTAFAAFDRVHVVRAVGGQQQEIPVELSDRVRPDDVVRVPVRCADAPEVGDRPRPCAEPCLAIVSCEESRVPSPGGA